MSQSSKAYYGIHGIINKSKAIIKPLGIIKSNKNEYIRDTFLSKISISDNITGYIFLNNIDEKNLISTKKLPILYASVDYYKSLLKKELFKVYLFFTIEDAIMTEAQLINTELKGTYTFEIEVDGVFKKLDMEMGTFEGKKKICNKLTDILKSNKMSSLYDFLINEIEENRKNKYSEYYSNIKPPVITHSFKK